MKIVEHKWNRPSDGRTTYDVRLTGATCDITTCVSRKVEMSIAYVVSRKSHVQNR